jgi:hypothetical protein
MGQIKLKQSFCGIIGCSHLLGYIIPVANLYQVQSALDFCLFSAQDHFVKEFKEPLNLKYIGKMKCSKATVQQFACYLWQVINDLLE